jgi:hypothetical protein
VRGEKEIYAIQKRKLEQEAKELNIMVRDFRKGNRGILRHTKYFSRITPREYQAEVIKKIADSVLKQKGYSFVVMFPRQSGKNELQAVLEVYLLVMKAERPVEIVKVSPTWKPQGLNAMRRLERVLRINEAANATKWKKEGGHIFRVGESSITFLSGSPNANVMGMTAGLLLECDEAQDVLPSKWDRDFAPMAASTNATRVFWGTAWTTQTLLARELRRAREAETVDGVPRAFVLTAEQVGAEVQAYREYVSGEMKRLGSSHPLVRSQYFSEEIDSQNRMFTETRLALLEGTHPRRKAPQEGRSYALLLDVAGEDVSARNGPLEIRIEKMSNPGRDATALTVVEVGLETLSDPALNSPTYRIVDRQMWLGESQAALYVQVRALAIHWHAQAIVVDATGIGAGLASFLEKAFPGKVISYVFSSKSKSDLGWSLLGLIDCGRLKDWVCPDEYQDGEQQDFLRQARQCEMEITSGPERRMKWGVPDGKRDPLTGELVHDDWLVSAALASALDRFEWSSSGMPVVIRRADPLEEMVGY